MKRILVPTDFSQVANNALRYAIEIAGDFHAELNICHAYHIHKVDYNPNFPANEQPFKKQVERQMKLTKLKFMEDITRKELSVHTIVDQDSIIFLLKDIVKNIGIDLIVMGSTGASGLERVIFGSVAANVMESAEIPVLVVPSGCTFQPIDHIVLAVDHREVKPDVLLPVRKLARKYEATVTMLNVKKDPDHKAHRKADIHIEGVETIYREVSVSQSINETINAFMKEEGCDLLCMIRREKGFFESVFQKSITKAQVHSNQSPLLVLPEV